MVGKFGYKLDNHPPAPFVVANCLDMATIIEESSAGIRNDVQHASQPKKGGLLT